MADLGALIARLEQATGPSREIDCYIYAETLRKAGDDRQVTVIPPPTWNETRYFFNPNPEIRWLGYDLLNNSPKYTSSLDSALTLVPEGWRLRDLCQANPLMKADMALAVLAPNEEYDSSEESPLGVHLTSPAIALCIAALKARTEVGNE